MPDPLDREGLRRAAEAATEGEWWDGRVHDPDGRSREVRANKPTLDPRPDDLAAVHPTAVRVVRQAIRHLFPLLDEGDTADGWSDAYVVTAALTDAGLLADLAPEGLSEEEREFVEDVRSIRRTDATSVAAWERGRLLAIIDRLSASTEEGTDG